MHPLISVSSALVCVAAAASVVVQACTEVACPSGQVDVDGLCIACDEDFVVLAGECVPGCTPGTTRACGTDEGECVTGVQNCNSDNLWGPCFDEVGPAPEVCDGLDNDCNGAVDDGVLTSRDDGQQTGRLGLAFAPVNEGFLSAFGAFCIVGVCTTLPTLEVLGEDGLAIGEPLRTEDAFAYHDSVSASDGHTVYVLAVASELALRVVDAASTEPVLTSTTTFDSPFVTFNIVDGAKLPQIALDTSDRAVIVGYAENESLGQLFLAAVRVTAGGPVENAKTITPQLSMRHDFDVETGPSGLPFLAYQDGSGSEAQVILGRVNYSTGTIDDEVTFAGASAPALAHDGAGRLGLAYVTGEGIRLRVLDASTLSCDPSDPLCDVATGLSGAHVGVGYRQGLWIIAAGDSYADAELVVLAENGDELLREQVTEDITAPSEIWSIRVAGSGLGAVVNLRDGFISAQKWLGCL